MGRTELTNSELVLRYHEAYRRNDHDRLDRMRTPDWVEEWPQSGERIRGTLNERLIHENYPGYPEIELTHVAGDPGRWAISPSNTVVRISGDGELWFVQGVNEYQSGPINVLSIIELSGGLVKRETVYFAEPFEPPAWRSSWSGRIPPGADDTPFEAASEAEERRRTADLKRLFTPHASRTQLIEGMRQLFDENAVQDLPQTGERFTPLTQILRLVEEHPNFTTITRLRRIVGIGNLYAVEASSAYAEQTWWEAILIAFRGDRIVHSVDHFAQASEAPVWRSAWVEPLETAGV
jgi:hypothetical protein